MTISDKALLNVLKLLEESDSVAIDIESGDLRLTARKGNAAEISRPRFLGGATQSPAPVIEQSVTAAPASQTAAVPSDTAAAETVEPSEEDGAVIVRSPMKGTFYRAPAPGEPPFCDEGDAVGPDDTVCLVEIMKLFNSIPAGVSGTVEKFYVGNAEPVDLGQPIAAIRPN